MAKPYRTIAKHSYLSGKDRGVARARAHVRYIQFRPGKEGEREERTFFNGLRDGIYNREVNLAISAQNPKGTVMHKLILSPGVEGADVQEYTREVMAELCSRKGQDLEWYAVVHDNTNNEHAHVVIMGRDDNGRTVKLDTKDYELIKQAGDEYLERNKLLDRSKDKDKDELDKDEAEKEKGSVNRFVDALKAAAQEFKRNYSKDDKGKNEKPETEYQKRKRERQEIQDADRAALGEDLDLDAKLVLQQKSEERQKADKEKAWKDYCKPVEINYALPDGTVFVSKYDRASSLEGLKDLRKAYEEDDHVAKNSLTQDDIKRVSDWIKEKETAIFLLEKKSQSLPEIVIAVDSETNAVYTKDSSFEELLRLTEQNKRRQIYLDPVEERALEKWLKAQEYKEPILVELEQSDQTVAYTREDSKQVLATLLEEYEHGDAVLTNNEVERLKLWIQNAKEEPEREISTFEEAENQNYYYDRKCSYDQLRGLDNSFREGEGLLSERDYKLLRVWLAEKEAERQLEWERQQEQQRLAAEREKERQEQERPIRFHDESTDTTYMFDRNSELEELKKLEESYLDLFGPQESKELERLQNWIEDKERQEFDRPIKYSLSEKESERRSKEQELRQQAEKEQERKYHEEPIFVKDLDDEDGPALRISKDDELSRLRALADPETWAESDNNLRQLDSREYDKLEKWINEKEQERDKQPLHYVDPSKDQEAAQVSKTDKLEKLKDLDLALETGTGPVMRNEDRQILKEWIADKEEKEIQRGDRILTKDASVAELQQSKEEAAKNIEKIDKWIAAKDVVEIDKWKAAKDIEKDNDKPISFTISHYDSPFEPPETFEYSKESSLEVLKDLANTPEFFNVELTEKEQERVISWIKEKEQERDKEPLKYVDRSADKDLPSIGKQSIVREISKHEKLERLKELDRALSEDGGPTMYKEDHAVLKEWIAEKEAKEERERPIEVLEFDEDPNPVSYSKEDKLSTLQALAAGVEAREIDLQEKDQEKLRDWIIEKEQERDRDEKPIQLVSRFADKEQPEHDQDYTVHEISKDEKLEALKQLDQELEQGSGRDATQEDREKLKRWIEEKEENEIERDDGVLNKDSDRSSLDRARQEEQKQLEKLEKWLAEKELEKSLDLMREYDKLEKDRAADHEKMEFVDDEIEEGAEEKETVSKDEKLEMLKELEKSYRESSPDERPGLDKEDYEKLQAWIEYKEQNEIEYGDRVYTKDTPLDELRKFRDDLKDSRYSQWIEKEKFAQLCNWIREQESKERDEKEIDEREKEAARAGKEPNADRVRLEQNAKDKTETNKERDVADRDDGDGVRHGKQLYNRETPLEELQKFKENLDNSRYENWIEKEDYAKLCGWIKAKEERGEDAFKPKADKDYRDPDRRHRDPQRDEHKPTKYRATAIEKRMQRAMRQDKAERLKAYYAEKAAQKERLEKEKHEAMWQRISVDKPVVQFINLLRKGAREVQKEIDKFQEKELAKLQDKLKDSDKEKPGEKEKPKDLKEIELPFPQPKSRLEELANKKALKEAERDKSSDKPKDKPDKPIDKPADLEKEAENLKIVLPYPTPKTHLETLANKKAIELARTIKEVERKKEREEVEKLQKGLKASSSKDLERIEKFLKSGADKLKKQPKDKDGEDSKPKPKEKEKEKNRDDERER